MDNTFVEEPVTPGDIYHALSGIRRRLFRLPEVDLEGLAAVGLVFRVRKTA